MSNFDVLIVGAGIGGVMAAAQLKNANGKLRVGLIDPADAHWHQPAWTLACGFSRNMASPGCIGTA